jgi:phosphopantetheine--protein transferase-like protein
VTATPGEPGRIGIDVVHLGRMDRMHDEFGALLEARLWHPDERQAAEQLSAAGRRRYLAASLAVKEAWIKTAGRRPPGWVFSDASLIPGPPATDGAAEIAVFARDMGTTPPETGYLHAGCRTDRTGRAAWYGVHDEWLIAVTAS